MRCFGSSKGKQKDDMAKVSIDYKKPDSSEHWVTGCSLLLAVVCKGTLEGKPRGGQMDSTQEWFCSSEWASPKGSLATARS